MRKQIQEMLRESAEIKAMIADTMAEKIETLTKKILNAYRNKNKIALCGNGGSAADSQHIATELVHQFEISRRKGIPALALNTNTSTITAIGNDWGFDEVFSRQVESLMNPGDILIGLTTSGNSRNVNRAFEQAKSQGIFTVALTGRDGGLAKDLADLSIIVPSDNTARIQESHITIGHIICKFIEEGLR